MPRHQHRHRHRHLNPRQCKREAAATPAPAAPAATTAASTPTPTTAPPVAQPRCQRAQRRAAGTHGPCHRLGRSAGPAPRPPLPGSDRGALELPGRDRATGLGTAASGLLPPAPRANASRPCTSPPPTPWQAQPIHCGPAHKSSAAPSCTRAKRLNWRSKASRRSAGAVRTALATAQRAAAAAPAEEKNPPPELSHGHRSGVPRARGQMAVLSVPMQLGTPNPFLAKIWTHMPLDRPTACACHRASCKCKSCCRAICAITSTWARSLHRPAPKGCCGWC